MGDRVDILKKGDFGLPGISGLNLTVLRHSPSLEFYAGSLLYEGADLQHLSRVTEVIRPARQANSITTLR